LTAAWRDSSSKAGNFSRVLPGNNGRRLETTRHGVVAGVAGGRFRALSDLSDLSDLREEIETSNTP
jgi:hypothetical protein